MNVSSNGRNKSMEGENKRMTGTVSSIGDRPFCSCGESLGWYMSVHVIMCRPCGDGNRRPSGQAVPSWWWAHDKDGQTCMPHPVCY